VLPSAIWPEWYGAHQIAFEAAVANGGAFKADTTILLMNVVRGSIVSVPSGFLAARIAGENKRSPLSLVVLLVALGFVMSAALRTRFLCLRRAAQQSP
jgi:Na+/H+ antiporter NhaD/arsenite permease-like protein